MGKRVLGGLLILVFSLSLAGCYYFSATKEMKAAEGMLAELKAAGGPTLVPYEYTSAEQYLQSAQMESMESDHKAARDFARRSKAAAEAGLSQVKKK